MTWSWRSLTKTPDRAESIITILDDRRQARGAQRNPYEFFFSRFRVGRSGEPPYTLPITEKLLMKGLAILGSLSMAA